MGEHLRESLQGDYVAIGSALAEPRQADPDHSGQELEAEGSSPASGNRLLAQAGLSIFALDLRPLASSRLLRDRLSAERVRFDPGATFFLDPVRSFDALIYVDPVTPVRESPASGNLRPSP